MLSCDLTALKFAFAIAITALQAMGADTFQDLAAQAANARAANDVPKAIELYQQAVAIKPDWAEGWWFLGTLAYDSDQYMIGARAFSEFVKLDEKATAWGFLGLCEFEIADYDHSLEHIRRALTIATGIEPGVDQVLRFHEVMLLTKLGLFDQATPKFRPFVRRGVKNQTLVAAVGLTALRRAMLPAEIPGPEQALVAAAGQAAYSWMAGDNAKTDAGFKTLLADYPKAPGVHYLYGSYLLSFRPVEEAVPEFRRELELNPHNADARATVALLMVRAGAQTQALPLARQAAQDGPTCAMAQYTYGVILAGAGNLKEAIERLEAAERLDPASIEYHMSLAGAYSKAGRNEDARRERKASIALAKESDGPQ
jgi:tetratricopeptide (TPR) repeat protein